MEFQIELENNLTYSDRHYYKLLEKYRNYFYDFFSFELLAFSYERTLNSHYMCVSSFPSICETFIETSAYREIKDYIPLEGLSVGGGGLCGFKYFSSNENGYLYNEFRKKIQEELNIHISFYVAFPIGQNGLHGYIWNFRVPVFLDVLEKVKNIIYYDYYCNIVKINLIMKQFEKEFFPIIIKKNLCRLDTNRVALP